MADQKLSALTELAAEPADNDELYIRDESEAASAESKRITVANLIAAKAVAAVEAAGLALAAAKKIILANDGLIQLGTEAGSLELKQYSSGVPEIAVLQPKDGNKQSVLVLIPKGTEYRASFQLFNAEDRDNRGRAILAIDGASVTLDRDVSGTGTIPTEFRIALDTKPFVNIGYSLGDSSYKWKESWVMHRQLVQALAFDHTWSGLTSPMTAGTALTRTQAVYVGGDSKMEKALATGEATMPAIALATGTISENAEGEFLLQGFFRDDTWNWTIGGSLYISKTTAGDLTQTKPSASGEQVQVVGVAITADIIHFNPSYALVAIS